MSDIINYKNAVDVIKTAILQSQARAAKAVNQEQLALYFGIGRFVSANTRKKNWGKGAIEAISSQLRAELPGLRGFSATSMRNMRIFYEEWRLLESNSSVTTDEIQQLSSKSSVTTDEFTEINNNLAVATAKFEEDREIRQLQLANMPDFPLREFLSISFTHHIAILAKAKAYDERVFYMKYADAYKPTVEDLEKAITQDLYHHQDNMPNNFLATIPDYKQAYRAIRMFKDNRVADYPLIRAGERWKTAKATTVGILDDTDEVYFTIFNAVRKDTKYSIMNLKNLHRRENKTTRVAVKVTFLDRDTAVCTVTDLGFGQFFPSSYRVWEKIITL